MDHLVGCGSTCVESGSIREHRGLGEIRVRDGGIRGPDIRESGPTEYPGYLGDIRDIRNQNQGWRYQVLSTGDLPDST